MSDDFVEKFADMAFSMSPCECPPLYRCVRALMGPESPCPTRRARLAAESERIAKETEAGLRWWGIATANALRARVRVYMLDGTFNRRRAFGPDDPDAWYAWQLERTKDNAPA